MVYNGGCYCGEIRYTIELGSPDDARMSICHCKNCKVAFSLPLFSPSFRLSPLFPLSFPLFPLHSLLVLQKFTGSAFEITAEILLSLLTFFSFPLFLSSSLHSLLVLQKFTGSAFGITAKILLSLLSFLSFPLFPPLPLSFPLFPSLS